MLCDYLCDRFVHLFRTFFLVKKHICDYRCSFVLIYHLFFVFIIVCIRSTEFQLVPEQVFWYIQDIMSYSLYLKSSTANKISQFDEVRYSIQKFLHHNFHLIQICKLAQEMIEKPTVALDREMSSASKGLKRKGLIFVSVNPTLRNVVVILAYLTLISSSSLWLIRLACQRRIHCMLKYNKHNVLSSLLLLLYQDPSSSS